MPFYALTDSDWDWDDQHEGRATVVRAVNPQDAIIEATRMEAKVVGDFSGWGITWKVAQLVDTGFAMVSFEDGKFDYDEFIYYEGPPESQIDTELFEKAMSELRCLEGAKETVPCPDGIEGCLVYHFRRLPGPIEQQLRKALRMEQ